METTPDNMYAPECQICGGTHFIQVPLCYQETKYTCGVACVQSILKCYGIEYRQDELAEKLHSKPVFGTDYRTIILFMRQLGFQANFAENMCVDSLRFLIDEGVTPLILIQAWPDDDVDFASDWSDNHYVIACGYDKNQIYFMDPYTLGNYTYIPSAALPERWHVIDKDFRRYYGSGIIIKNEQSPFVYNPNEVKYLG